MNEKGEAASTMEWFATTGVLSVFLVYRPLPPALSPSDLRRRVLRLLFARPLFLQDHRETAQLCAASGHLQAQSKQDPRPSYLMCEW